MIMADGPEQVSWSLREC